MRTWCFRAVGLWKKGNAWIRDHSPRFYLNADLAPVLLDHIEPSVYMDHWSVQPFNGQARRIKSIFALAEAFAPTHVVETGTYMGSSTPYLASFASGPTYTIEIEEQYAARARKRFELNHAPLSIELVLGDSAQRIREVLARIPAHDSRVLAYLDAHWLDQIPTTEELEALDAWGGCWLAIIDDFKVEGDSGYGFDLYGDVVIGPAIVPDITAVQIWIPAELASRETGARRGTGYVVSAKAVPLIPEHALEGLRRVR